MASILLLGLFIGMQHALEADHIAAVASIAAICGTALVSHAILGAAKQ